MNEKQQTLFERVGGEQAINDLIHEFYDRVLADLELKPFFKKRLCGQAPPDAARAL